MKLVRLGLKNFRSFGPAATVIDLADAATKSSSVEERTRGAYR